MWKWPAVPIRCHGCSVHTNLLSSSSSSSRGHCLQVVAASSSSWVLFPQQLRAVAVRSSSPASSKEANLLWNPLKCLSEAKRSVSTSILLMQMTLSSCLSQSVEMIVASRISGTKLRNRYCNHHQDGWPSYDLLKPWQYVSPAGCHQSLVGRKRGGWIIKRRLRECPPSASVRSWRGSLWIICFHNDKTSDWCGHRFHKLCVKQRIY